MRQMLPRALSQRRALSTMCSSYFSSCMQSPATEPLRTTSSVSCVDNEKVSVCSVSSMCMYVDAVDSWHVATCTIFNICVPVVKSSLNHAAKFCWEVELKV